MSRGLGKVQQDILAALTAEGNNWTYNNQLAEDLDKSPRQTLNALAALARRGLIETRREGNHTTARTLHDDGTTRPEALLDTKIRQSRAVHEAQKSLYFQAMDEVLARGISFTADDVRARVDAILEHDAGAGRRPARTISGVFSTYLRKRYIEKIGTEKTILGRSINRYAPLPAWYTATGSRVF